MSDEHPAKPFDIMLDKNLGFASFTQRHHLGNRIGYRFFEHLPLVFGAVPDAEDQPAKVDTDEQDFSDRRGVEVYRYQIIQQDGWVDQAWTFYLAPAQRGIDMLWVVETQESGLPYYYGVQQCFRLGGLPMQRGVARLPRRQLSVNMISGKARLGCPRGPV
jgi:hypothetical protein